MAGFIISMLITLLPDYLFRRYVEGKRFGHEITLSNFWYELRWGIGACAVLLVALFLFGGSQQSGAPKIKDFNVNEPVEELPFFVTGPGQTDVLLVIIAILMALIVLGLGALYFWIQAWPDRLAVGASKVQLQMVGILGLISLLTLNNAFWIAGLLLATIRFPDIVTPLKDIAKSLAKDPAKKD